MVTTPLVASLEDFFFSASVSPVAEDAHFAGEVDGLHLGADEVDWGAVGNLGDGSGCGLFGNQLAVYEAGLQFDCR
jgi:hypothetical protein